MFYKFAALLKSNKKNMDKIQSCIRLFADKVQIENCRQMLHDNKKALKKLSKIFSLAGNEVRLKILFLLEEEHELCPCDLSDILGMSIPAISQHLRKLKDGGLVETRRDGQTIFYSLLSGNETMLRPIFKDLRKNTKKEEV